MDMVPVAAAAPYAAADADMTWRLRHILETQLRDRDERLWKLYTEIELPLVSVLVTMERTGLALDPTVLRDLSHDLGLRLQAIEQQIYDAVGHHFNINSPIQLGKILFEELHLPGARKTKTGYSTDAQVLEGLRGAHEVVNLVLEYRQLAKLKSTYADTLPDQINATTGRVHTNMNQTIAATGRLSSVNPNLQNIPVRTSLGRHVRTAFVAGETDGEPAVLLSADYSQIELRILAHVSRDPRLLAAFANDEDIHAATAADVFGVPQPDVTGAMRRIAKCVAVDTLVFSDRGLMPIEALGQAGVDEFAPVRLMVSHQGEPIPATEFYNGGRQATIRIRTELGFCLEATPNHRVKAVSPTGEYGWRTLGELQERDWVALAVGSGVFGEDGQIAVEFARRQTVRGLDMPGQLSGGLARFLGYVAGAGYLNGRESSPTLTIWAESAEVVEDLDGLSREIFHRPPTHLPRKTGTQLRWYNSRMREFLAAMRLASRGADDSDKAVPGVILQAGRESLVQFLRGLFEGGAEVVANTVSFSTRSVELAHQVQLLLLGIGIVASVRTHSLRSKQGVYFDLRLHGKESLRRYLELVGFVSEQKQAQLASLVDSSGRLRDWTIPHQAGRIQRMFPRLSGSLRERLQLLVHRRNFDAAYSPPVSVRMVRRVLREYPHQHDPDYLALADLMMAPVFFDAIASVEPGEAEVRDLSVPDAHAYTANGFISHNTVNFGVIYGLSGFGLAERVPELNRSEADLFIKAYFERYHGVQEYLATTKKFAHEHGYVETLTGRRRLIPEIHAPNAHLRNAAERMAVNMPVQGLAADIIKIAMIRVQAELERRGLRSRMLLQVHDELLFEVPPSELELMRELAPRLMSEAMPLAVPVKVDVKVGSNWGELERVDEQEAAAIELTGLEL
ncbi:MAG: DNA polymerase [Chloroflexi bacterium]|nr:DNA polymerase [Chloroflexota bacterium]